MIIQNNSSTRTYTVGGVTIVPGEQQNVPDEYYDDIQGITDLQLIGVPPVNTAAMTRRSTQTLYNSDGTVYGIVSSDGIVSVTGRINPFTVGAGQNYSFAMKEGDVLTLTGNASAVGTLARQGSVSLPAGVGFSKFGPYSGVQVFNLTVSSGSFNGEVKDAAFTTSAQQAVANDRVSSQVLRADMIIYGSTFGGVMAACTAAQAGASVILISENGRIGGMMTGGLQRVDYRGYNPRVAMGVMTMEFFRRCAAVYGMSLGEFGLNGTSPFAVEAKVALSVLRDMLNEYQVPVLYNYRVTNVNKQAGDIKYLDLANRLNPSQTKRVHGRFFGEASYTSNLLIRTGISYTFGREANATYSETYNGVGVSAAHPGNPSPYVIAGNAGSGLLPYIDANAPATAGTADNRLQAFCHRLLMTNVPSNRLPIPEPLTYNPLWYEVLGRSMAAVPSSYQTLDQMFYRAPVPLGGTAKQDWNSQGQFSTDFVGGNTGYVTTNYAQQDQIVLDHTNYTLGLFKFLREDSRVPSALKTALADWGFCADEFIEDGTGGLSPELYVRESARMVGDYVMTEANYAKTVVAAFPVTNANYPMDSHLCGRYNVSGVVRSEGGLSSVNVPVGYYGIEYRCMLPKANECGNYANFGNGVSMSHTLFGSARMEVTFGSLGEAAAAAMVLAIKGKVRLHDISGADIQPLVRPYVLNPARVLTVLNGNPNGTATAFGSITTSNIAGWTQNVVFPPEFYGISMWNEGNGNKGGRYIEFKPAFGATGRYRILLNAPAETTSQRKARIDVVHADGTATFYIDHKFGEWHFRDLGVWRFLGDNSGSIRITNAGDPSDSGSDVGLLNIDGVAWHPVP